MNEIDEETKREQRVRNARERTPHVGSVELVITESITRPYL